MKAWLTRSVRSRKVGSNSRQRNAALLLLLPIPGPSTILLYQKMADHEQREGSKDQSHRNNEPRDSVAKGIYVLLLQYLRTQQVAKTIADQ